MPPSDHDSPDVELNPYTAPRAEIGGESLLGEFDIAEAEATRRHHLSHEASVKAIGGLNYLGALFGLGAGCFMLAMGTGLIAAPPAFQQEGGRAVSLGVGLFFLGLGVLNGFVGHGLRQLRPWARWTEAVLVSIGCLAYIVEINPIGLIISLYILYLMLSRKGAVVFSPSYQKVIAQTPNIRYRTSLIVKIALVVLLVIIGLIVVAAVMSVLGRK